MKRYASLALLLACLMLAGCDWMDGNLHSVTPHESHTQSGDSSDVSAADYAELWSALDAMVAEGREKGIIYVPEYDQQRLDEDMTAALTDICGNTPLGAYAVEEIRYDLGTNGGKSAIAVEISYRHGWGEIQRIRKMEDMEAARQEIYDALRDFDTGLVLWVETYGDMDVGQLVEDYAGTNPQYVMEVPQVVVTVYPDAGESRILELKFSYQNSREDLRKMQSYVTAIFKAAGLYVSSDDTEEVKLNQLYGFLMERFEYKVDTSMTPSYSLLRHGVGDSKAFAMVYAAICRQAELQCLVVTGTRDGEPWYWNMVGEGNRYYHVDLLRCMELGGLGKRTDGQMTGYVWDYSAYPTCPDVEVVENEPEPATEPDEEPENEPTEEPTGEPTEEATDPPEPTEEPTEPPTEAPTDPPPTEEEPEDTGESP